MDYENLSIAKIKKELESIPINEYPSIIPILKNDTRKGVQDLSIKLYNSYNSLQLEINRINDLKNFQKRLAGDNEYIAGMDEVGRGPLAGPVVSCALILPKDSNILYINDSKKISSKLRDKLYEDILKEAISVGIGIVDSNVIDDINIYKSTKESMRIAINKLEVNPDIVLIDAMTLEDFPLTQKSIIKGDEKCYSIAAASIIAKVTRDRMMENYHNEYPQYNFLSNKGYGSQEHIDAIKKYGICPIHRLSFLNNILIQEIN